MKTGIVLQRRTCKIYRTLAKKC